MHLFTWHFSRKSQPQRLCQTAYNAHPISHAWLERNNARITLRKFQGESNRSNFTKSTQQGTKQIEERIFFRCGPTARHVITEGGGSKFNIIRSILCNLWFIILIDVNKLSPRLSGCNKWFQKWKQSSVPPVSRRIVASPLTFKDNDDYIINVGRIIKIVKISTFLVISRL